MDLGLGHLWGELFKPCANGGFLDVAKANLMYGLQINYGWAIEHGRLTQTLLAFLIGMLLGRKRLFINEGNHLQVSPYYIIIRASTLPSTSSSTSAR